LGDNLNTMFSNSTKVWIFIVGACLIFLVSGYKLGGRVGLMLGLVMAIVINVLIFFYGENHILNLMPVKKMKGQDPWGLEPLIRDFSY
jgi:hypothetical protein